MCHMVDYHHLFAPSCGPVEDFTDGWYAQLLLFCGVTEEFYAHVYSFDLKFFWRFILIVHSHLMLLQHLMIHLPMTKKPKYVLSDVPKYWLEDDGNMCLDETHRWRSAGAIAWLRTYGLQSVSNSIKAEISDLVYKRIRGRASYDPPPGLWQYAADVS